MDVALLVKYLSENCTLSEKNEVEEWLKEDEKNEHYLALIKQMWNIEPESEFRPNVEEALNRLESRLGGLEIPQQQGSQENKQIRWLHRSFDKQPSVIRSWIYVAASILILAIGVIYVIYWLDISTEPELVGKEVVMREIKTDRGQRTTLRLQDGTKVTLNTDSQIDLSAEYGREKREVYLTGEAYFEVKEDKERPFIVYSKNTFTRVLGTKFAILAHETAKVLAVVEEGRVVFGSNENTANNIEELRQNEVAEIDKNGNAKVFRKNDLQKYLGWKDGLLVFEDASYNEVVSKLERWYDIDIVMQESMPAFHTLTATFSDEPMTEVLNVVAATLHIRYDRDGNTIMFKKK